MHLRPQLVTTPCRIAGLSIALALMLGSTSLAQDSPETVWVEAGTVMWDRPGAHANEVARVQTLAELPVLEVTRGWVRVLYLDRSGWIEQPGLAADAAQTSASPCDQIHLETEARCLDLGWVWLLTDLPPERGREVEQLLRQLPDRYQGRFGRLPADSSPAWFAVLESQGDYEDFLQQVRRWLAVDASAVASGRVASVATGDIRAPLAAVLNHEGAHLLNRVALGDAVPVWLEEGTAGCLELIADDGQIGGGTQFAPVLVYHQPGWSEERTEVTHGGARAALARLRQRASDAGLNLAPILDAGRREFYRSSERESNYELSSLLACYLADRAFPLPLGGLIAAYGDGRLEARLGAEPLAPALAAWADELLRPLEESSGQ